MNKLEYLIFILCFLVPPGVWSMDETLDLVQNCKRPHATAFPDTPTISEEIQENKRKRREIKVNLLETCPVEIKLLIFKYAVITSLDKGDVDKLPIVCKKWQSILKDNKIPIFKFAICEIFQVDTETCERFLNGRLVYKPNQDSDIDKIELRIADLSNPLEGKFNLSQCGKAGEYLSIYTGYRKLERMRKFWELQIWLTPRFLVEREIKGSASHFEDIFPSNWPKTAPVGIIWTWSSWDDLNCYDYETDQTMDSLGDTHLNGWHDICSKHRNQGKENEPVTYYPEKGRIALSHFSYLFKLIFDPV